MKTRKIKEKWWAVKSKFIWSIHRTRRLANNESIRILLKYPKQLKIVRVTVTED